MQASLRDVADSAPDHCDKSEYHNKACYSKLVGFPVHMKVMFTLYCYLLSVQ